MNPDFKSLNTDKLKLLLSTIIFGTIGIFVKYIPLASGVIALVRGLCGSVFLLLLMIFKKEKLSPNDIKKDFLPLCLSGIFLGINWVFLFESYRYTAVSIATLCYYTAPVFMIIISAIVFKEKMSIKKLLCIFASLAGMIFVSGILEEKRQSVSQTKGIIFGLCAAVFYALVVLSTKKIRFVSSHSMTSVQLFISAVVILPYALITNGFSGISPDLKTIVLLAVVGIVHTGVAYALYLSSVKKLKSQTVAVFSYIDPIVAITLSAFVLKEKLSLYGILGLVIILLSAFVSELPDKKASD